MALPQLVNAWVFSVNNIINEATGSDCHRRVWLSLINGLIANGFTVAGSCDSVAAGMDGVNRVTEFSDIVHGSSTSARSWIVLAAPDGVQHLLEWGISSIAGFRYYISNTVGFSGGAINTRPTASDEITVNEGTLNSLSTSSAWDAVLHMGFVPSTGEFWALLLVGGLVKTVIFYRRVTGAPVAWSKPCIAHAGSSTTNWANFSTTNACKGSRLFTLHITGEGYGSTSLTNITTLNELSGEWPLIPMGVYSPTAGYRGRHGRIDDWFWGAATPTLVMGTTYPADGSRQFIQFDQFILPWNGSIPLVA